MPRPSARERLLDCAERLFAERGLRGVSLRAINAEAGLSPAALHYHFGTQEALVEALLERRMAALMARRAALLEALDEAPQPPTVRQVLETLIEPMAALLREEGEAGLRYVQLVSRLHAEGDIDHAWVIGRHPDGVERIGPLMRAALPDVPEPTLLLRAKWAIDLMLFSLAQGPAVFGEGLDPYVSHLLDFVSGAMVAPISSPPSLRDDPAAPPRPAEMELR
jgi:AcrR family transcriptional regulator